MEDLGPVLLVDDDPDIRTIAEISLAKVGGLTTILADGGHEAIRRAAADLPSVILLDMMMPELDGLGTLQLLRSDPATSVIPVIFMTAKIQETDISNYIDAGAIGVIAKPFDPMTLAAEVRELVAAADTAGV
jgi:CheY-like chemotaxis protein